jgi:ATP-binding cassette subfamily A (ABC1) protein 3
MLWDKLKEYKEGRIIILTTHFMDEADYLGDRIGIMGDGRIKTCGTSMFLKKRFGVGYTLDIFTKEKDESNNNKITQLV